jgi:hypothetical protein
MHRGWFAALALLAFPVQAGLFRCEQPDGSVSYQQTACAGSSEGGAVEVDTRPPGGAGSAPSGDYSVEGQLKQMRPRQDRERKESDQRRKRPAGRTRDGEDPPTRAESSLDAAKCARHRAAVADWDMEVRRGYRDRNEKAYNENMLDYHRTQVERYCD